MDRYQVVETTAPDKDHPEGKKWYSYPMSKTDCEIEIFMAKADGSKSEFEIRRYY